MQPGRILLVGSEDPLVCLQLLRVSRIQAIVVLLESRILQFDIKNLIIIAN